MPQNLKLSIQRPWKSRACFTLPAPDDQANSIKYLYTCTSQTPSTRSRVFSKTEMFFSEYGYRKRRFSNTLSRVETFENGDLSYSCGRAKTAVSNTMTSCLGSRLALRQNYNSKDADLFEHRGKSLRFWKYLATCGRSNTIRKRYMWTQILLNTEKKISVFENTRLRVDGASICIQGLNTFLKFFWSKFQPVDYS